MSTTLKNEVNTFNDTNTNTITIPHVNEIKQMASKQKEIMTNNSSDIINVFIKSKIPITIAYINNCIQNGICENPTENYVFITNADIFKSWAPISNEELHEYAQSYNILSDRYVNMPLSTYNFDNQFENTKNKLVLSVLSEVFKLYHKQGYRTKFCRRYGHSLYDDCFDISWHE